MSTVISNPEFSTLSQGPARWSVAAHQGVTMVPTVNDAVLRLDISDTAGVNWHGELCYAPFPVKAGNTLAVSFVARAKHPFTFSVWLGQSAPPYESLVPPENHFGEETMTSEWRTYVHSWKPVRSDHAARLNFVVGQIDNQIELKQIALATMERA